MPKKQYRSSLGCVGFFHGRPHRSKVMRIHINHIPARGFERRFKVHGHHFFNTVSELDFVVVHEHHKIIQFIFIGKIHHFINLSFLRFAITDQSIHTLAGAFQFFSQRHSGGHRNSRTQRSSSIPNSFYVSCDVSFINVSDLSEICDHIIAWNPAHLSQYTINSGGDVSV